MTRGHVYSDPRWLTPERALDKWAVIQAPGARYAGIRLVTGELDPFTDRQAFVNAVLRVADPPLLVYGAQTPRKSRAEMEALAEVDHVETARLDRGKLAVHEEFPDAVACAVKRWLAARAHGLTIRT